MSLFEVKDRQQLDCAIEAVRSDETTEDWLLLGHENGSSGCVVVKGTGSDGLDGLKACLDPSNVNYGLLKTSSRLGIDDDCWKFVYIYYIPVECGSNSCEEYGVLYKEVKNLLCPIHFELRSNSLDEINMDVIETRLSAGSSGVTECCSKGSVNESHLSEDCSKDQTNLEEQQDANKYASPISDTPEINQKIVIPNVEATPAQEETPAYEKTLKSVATPRQKPARGPECDMNEFAEAELIDAISTFRQDMSSKVNSWLICTYRDHDLSKKLYLIKEGTGPLKSLNSFLGPKDICYILYCSQYSTTEGIKYERIILVRWLGQEVSLIKKAKFCTQRGDVSKLFYPYHASIDAEDLSELSESAIDERLKAVRQ